MKTILLTGAISMIVALLGTKPTITVLRKRKLGQQIRTDGPQGHMSKSGTPTMGGIVIIIASLIGYVFGHLFTGDPMSASGLLVLFLMTGLGFVGFLDDFIKLFMRRSLGLRSGAKLAGQAIVGIIFAVLALHFPDGYDITPASAHISFLTDFGWSVGPVLFVVWVLIMVTGTSNGVNLTDGLDGLAIVPVMIAAASFGMIAYLAGNAVFSDYLQINYVAGTGELAVLCGAVLGAGLGFLWFNAPPASIFMGDTGSLALGGMLGSVAVAVKHEIVLAVIGGLFVLEAVSVIVQVASFKLTGKRIFRMAPIHHHFEQLGWTEPQIVIRFWIISVMLALAGLSTLKLR